MKSLAIFVHFSRDGKVCPNAMLYAEELTKYFNSVVISSNIFITTKNSRICCLQFDKNAYDFGYFYQALEMIDAYNDYNIIGFFNDSNYIINSLDNVIEWCFNNNLDYCGITDSHESCSELNIKNQYHIQSHFLIFKNKTVKKLQKFFIDINFGNLLENNNIDDIRRKIITECEIMLSVTFRENDMRIGSYYTAKTFTKKFENVSENINIHIFLWKELIDNKYPFIKRKIVNNGFNIDEIDYIDNQSQIYPMSKAMYVIKDNCDEKIIKTIFIDERITTT